MGVGGGGRGVRSTYKIRKDFFFGRDLSIKSENIVLWLGGGGCDYPLLPWIQY